MPDKKLPAVLLLADGTIAHGQAFGAIGTATGEICFNTGMTGYQEVFTDPSYFGQILIMNSAHIGNYGVKDGDVESNSVKINGLIGRNLEDDYSRKLANGSLNDYLKANKIVSIEGVDTRALVAHVRTKGAMNCIISSETTDIEVLKKKLAGVPNMDGLELASIVSTKEAYELGDKNAAIRIAVMDYGVKKNILNCLVERGAFVKVFPAQLGGPKFIKDVLAPMPFLKLVPTGGVSPENACDYLSAGAVAVGIGGNLASNKLVAAGAFGQITLAARACMDAVHDTGVHQPADGHFRQ